MRAQYILFDIFSFPFILLRPCLVINSYTHAVKVLKERESLHGYNKVHEQHEWSVHRLILSAGWTEMRIL